MRYEEILQIRARDRQGVFVAALFATILHYLAILLIEFPDAPPKLFDVPPPENLVLIRRFTPATMPIEALPPVLLAPAPPVAGAAASPVGASPVIASPQRLGDEGVPPTVLSRVEPEYPEVARKALVRGIVSLDVVIHADGSVGEIVVRDSLGRSGCDEAAILAAKRSKFAAGSIRGRPVDALLTLEYRFQ